MEVGAAAGRALGEERERARRHPEQLAREQAAREQVAREQANPEQARRTQAAPGQEWTTGHQRTWGWQAGQERTKADDSRALERRHPAVAPPLIEVLTPIGRPGYRLGEPSAEPYDEHLWA